MSAEGVQDRALRGLLPQEEYFPYGSASDRRDARNRYRYIGVERDEETGLCMTGPRTYEPVVGRFLQSDPTLTPHAGPFVYAQANPIRGVDPNGYQPNMDATAGAVYDVAAERLGPAALGLEAIRSDPIGTAGHVWDRLPGTRFMRGEIGFGELAFGVPLSLAEGAWESVKATPGALYRTFSLSNARGNFSASWSGDRQGLASSLDRSLSDSTLLAQVAGTAAGGVGLASRLRFFSPASGPRLAGPLPSGTATGQVLLDSSVIPRLGRDPTLGGRILPGEQGVISYVTAPELRNAVAKGGGLRGVPRLLGDLPVLQTRPDVNSVISFRGTLARESGRFGDAIIGTQATDLGIPLITNDAELRAAVLAAGGTVR